MKKIHVVRRDQFDEKRISLYKRHSLSSLKEYIDCKAGEITYISTQSFKNISWGEDTIIFEDIALLEADILARSYSCDKATKGIYIDAENIDDFKVFCRFFRNKECIPFDFIVYGIDLVEINSLDSIQLPKYTFTSRKAEIDVMSNDAKAMWKVASNLEPEETIKVVLIHPNNLHRWNTRQAVKDAHNYIHELNDILLKFENTSLSIMIDSSRYISITEMTVFNRLVVPPDLVNPREDIDDTLYSSNLIVFIPSAYKCKSDYEYVLGKIAHEYGCQVISLSNGKHRKDLELKNEGKQDKCIQDNSRKKEVASEEEIWTLNQYVNSDYMPEEGDTVRSRNENDLTLIITNIFSIENEKLNQISEKKNVVIVDWLMRSIPLADIWLDSRNPKSLCISHKFWEQRTGLSENRKTGGYRKNETYISLETKDLSIDTVILLKRLHSLREALANSNTNKATNLERLICRTSHNMLKIILSEIVPDYCIISDFEECLINEAILGS